MPQAHYQPAFDPSATSKREAAAVSKWIEDLHLQKHPEGGYFVETDRDARLVENPFRDTSPKNDLTRNASTTIYYYLTPNSSYGAFHRNKGRTVHTLHRGRGRYVLIHADEHDQGTQQARIETFVVGHDVQKGERLQWIVEGNKYKASFLLPDTPSRDVSEGLLISETVVPGFSFDDHNFLPRNEFESLVPPDDQADLSWLVRKG